VCVHLKRDMYIFKRWREKTKMRWRKKTKMLNANSASNANRPINHYKVDDCLGLGLGYKICHKIRYIQWALPEAQPLTERSVSSCI